MKLVAKVIFTSAALCGLLSVGAACGSSVGGPDTADAGVAADGGPSQLACRDDPDPTTAPDTITISGKVTQGVSGAASSGTTVALLGPDEVTPLVTPAVTDATGAYSLEVPTGGAPVALVGELSKTGYVDEWFYGGGVIAQSYDGVDGLMLKSSDIDGFVLLLNSTYDASKGLVAVIVVDCQGNLLPGATVTLSPTPGLLRYADDNGYPGSKNVTGKTGLVYGWNVPVGAGDSVAATVSGSYLGVPLKSHSFKVHKGDVTLTLLYP